ncbi:MAG: capsular biosynthesis protein [Cytophagales bacterium]|nr:capsular biosynthesis protein [Cytophagales bacterium]
MGFWDKIFGEKNQISTSCVKVDMHSHILPNLDDGSDSVEESMALIQQMIDLGYEKLIMTPHIMGDFYKNTPEGIREKLQILRKEVIDRKLDITLDCASEYYLDEGFVDKFENGTELLTFGDNYILIETSYMNRPHNFNDIIFRLKSSGYKPILAHPERYTYLYQGFELFEEMYDRGVLFQINLNSLTGYYSGIAKKYTEKLIDKKMVDFIGTDCHAEKHLRTLQKAMNTKYYKKLQDLNLLNDSLL